MTRYLLSPERLRRLHRLAPISQSIQPTTHNGFIWRFRAAGLLLHAEIEGVFRCYEQICTAYPRLDADLVPC